MSEDQLGVMPMCDDENSEGSWESDADDEVEAGEKTQCLFSGDVFPSSAAALEHDKTHFGFDLGKYISQVGMDEYEVIRCINYIRTSVSQSRDPRSELAGAVSTPEKPWRDDKYLIPVLPDDAMLFHEFGSSVDLPQASSSRERETPAASQGTQEAHRLRQELAQMRHENAELRAALQDACLASLPPEAAQYVQDSMGSGMAGLDVNDNTNGQSVGAPGAPSGPPAKQLPLSIRVPPGQSRRQRSEKVEKADEAYFDSYGYFDIHRTMLGDKVRTEAYQRALEGNPSLMRGARVLDVGCGTGILSMFAARGGASQIAAVEGSERMAEAAQSIIEENQLSSSQGGPISVVSGRVEELQALPMQQVDVIVSEWMGYGLFFECMLDSVLHVRDRFLKPGGAVLPDRATMYIAGAGPGALDLEFWRDVYGFSYRPVQAQLLRDGLKTAHVTPVSADDIVTAACELQSFDLTSMTPQDAEFNAHFTLQAPASATGAAPQEVHAIVLWFDTEFSPRFCKEQSVVLTTSPHAPQTHWYQTVLQLRQPLAAQHSAGAQQPGQAILQGRISCARGGEHRCLDISLECVGLDSKGQSIGEPQTQLYSIAMS
ncbi:g8207 [Coccomyxa viridis]|uniref:type I protein arginine methyltransferase n=1 Tax=Coccomyxa viridis TaxID=1274662 RepID=A0ABP1FZT2_9CHLO